MPEKTDALIKNADEVLAQEIRKTLTQLNFQLCQASKMGIKFELITCDVTSCCDSFKFYQYTANIYRPL